MNTKLVIANILTLSALAAVLLHGQGGGPLNPPAAPADGVYRTLEEIYAVAVDAGDSRTPIDHVPFWISAPGSYYLTRSLHLSSPAGASAITVAAPNVTIDLNGFTISSSESVTGRAITTLAARRNLTVRNGNIEGTTKVHVSVGANPVWTTTKGGFGIGVSGANRIEDISVRGCRAEGIQSLLVGLLGTDASGVIVRGCSAEQNGSTGIDISHGLLADCVAIQNGGTGIRGWQASAINSAAEENGNNGVDADLLTGCRARRNNNIGLRGNAVSSSAADFNGTGIAARVVSHSMSISNRDIGIEGFQDAAISLSFSRSNANADIQTSGVATRTGNSPSP